MEPFFSSPFWDKPIPKPLLNGQADKPLRCKVTNPPYWATCGRIRQEKISLFSAGMIRQERVVYQGEVVHLQLE